MKTVCYLLTFFPFLIWLTSSGQENAPLTLTGVVSLPGVKGRIDHLAFNSRKNLVYIAALGNNSVEVVDLKSKKVVYSLKGLEEPQGVRYIPETNSIIVANGGNGELNMFDASTLKMIKSVKLGDDADNVRYDAKTGTIYAGYGKGAIAALDAITLKQKSVIRLSGHPESFQLEDGKIFVNVPTAHLLEVIDLKLNKVIEKWEVKEAASNFPMALNQASHSLFIGCRHPAKLLVIDTETGKTITSSNSDGDSDDLFYDNTTKQIYMSCGDGYIDIFKKIDTDKYQVFTKIETRPGARTSLYIPELNQLIVAAPARDGKEAQLMIYKRE